jgi:hypothetical protein
LSAARSALAEGSQHRLSPEVVAADQEFSAYQSRLTTFGIWSLLIGESLAIAAIVAYLAMGGDLVGGLATLVVSVGFQADNDGPEGPSCKRLVFYSLSSVYNESADLSVASRHFLYLQLAGRRDFFGISKNLSDVKFVKRIEDTARIRLCGYKGRFWRAAA